MSNTQLDALLVDEPEAVQAEILRINTDARNRSLQVALLVPVLASLIGLVNSFRMRRLPDITPPSLHRRLDLGLTPVVAVPARRNRHRTAHPHVGASSVSEGRADERRPMRSPTPWLPRSRPCPSNSDLMSLDPRRGPPGSVLPEGPPSDLGASRR